MHPVLAEDVAGELGELVGGHRARRGVRGHHDLREDRLELVEHALHVLVPEDRDDADDPLEVEALGQRPERRRHARGLCPASAITVGERRRMSSRPGELAAANPARTRTGSRPASDSLTPRVYVPSSSVPRYPSAHAGERLDGRERAGRVGRLVPAEQRQVHVAVDAAQPLQHELLAAEGDLAGEHAELESLAGHGRADERGALQQDLRGARPGCCAITAVAPGLMMPDFSVAISSMVSPSHCMWSIAIGVITATAPSATLVASQRPPMPTSMTATSTGASANAANIMPVSTSKKDSWRGLPLVHQLDVGRGSPRTARRSARRTAARRQR